MKNVIDRVKNNWWTMVCLPLLPAVNFYIERSSEFTLSGLIQAFILISVSSLSLTLLLRPILVNIYYRSFLVNFFLYLLVDYGSIARLLLGSNSYKFFLVYYVAICTFLLFISMRLLKNFDASPSKFVKIVGFVLCVYFTTSVFKLSQVVILERNYSAIEIASNSDVLTTNNQSTDRPNIVYIILDEYTRNDFLEKEFNFDNSPFCDSLEQFGFKIVRKSRSNYWTTPYSLASSLNLNYLDSLLSENDPRSWITLNSLMNDNSLVEFIHNQNGVVFSTNASLGRNIFFRNYDSCIQTDKHFEQLYDFGYCFWPTTAFHPISNFLSRGRTKDMADKHKERIQEAWDSVENHSFSSSGNVLIAHILSPHPPFLFNGTFHEEGGVYQGYYPFFNLSSISDSLWMAGYCAQIEFVNKSVIDVVRSHLNSPRKPIVVIQISMTKPN